MRWLGILLLSTLVLAYKVAVIGESNIASVLAINPRVELVGFKVSNVFNKPYVPLSMVNYVYKLKPDLIVAPYSLKGKIKGNVIYVDFSNWKNYVESVTKLAKALGNEERGKEIIKFMERIREEVESRVWDVGERVKVWSDVEGWKSLVKTLYAKTSNVTQADVILTINGTYANSPALKHFRIYFLWKGFGNNILTPILYEAFAKAIYPARMIDVDVNATLNEFLRFLHMKADYAIKRIKIERHWVTVEDVLGRKVRVLVPAKKVVLLYGLEDWVAVGGEDALTKLVGMNSWRYKKWRPDWWVAWTEHFPWLKDLPDVGQPGWSFNLEKVIELKPDVVITAPWMYNQMVESGDLERLKAAGIPVVVIDFVPHTANVKEHLKAVRRSLEVLGVISGYEDRAERLYKFYLSQFDKVIERVRYVKERPKVLIFTTWSPWKVYGAKGHVSTWVEMAKGDNVAARIIKGSSGYVNPEFVLQVNPDVIIFMCNNNFPNGVKVVIGYTVNNPEPAIKALKELIDRPGWQYLKAVREGRVYLMHLGLAHGHVFQFVALQYIAKWLHPSLFKDLRPLDNLKEFYQEFMPYPLRGVWAVGLG